MPQFQRESRRYRFVPGTGGGIEIRLFDAVGDIIGGQFGTSFTYFDVNDYIVDQSFLNEITTHSGLNGGTGRTRVGSDWNFAAVLSFPAFVLGDGALQAAYVQQAQMLGSSRGVWLTFNLGDPEWWRSKNLPVRTQQGGCMLDKVVERVVQQKVIGLNVTGSADGLLFSYLDGAVQHPVGWE